MVNRARPGHRITQFFATLFAPLLPVDTAYAAVQLSPVLLTLFQRMARAEQRHGIALCRRLAEQGHTTPDLLAAALLHDVGKLCAPPRLWERVWVVLAEAFAPERAARWSASTSPRWWQRALVARRQHAAWGAELAAEAGATARTVSLIRTHHDPPGDDADLRALQVADET